MAALDWLYLASDFLACVRDTRGLALEEGLIWYSHSPPPSPLPKPGERLLLVFKRNHQIAPLGLFELCAARSCGVDPAPQKFGECVGIIPEERRDVFARAAPGQNGGGFNRKMTDNFRALCVSLLAGFAQDWGGSTEPHDIPRHLLFGLSEHGRKVPYLARFDSSMLTEPVLPPRFLGENQ